MNAKELRKLSRMELLELLLVQTREMETLRQKLERTESALMDRYLRVQEAGDLAHAVLEVNGFIQAAQDSARQYLDNIAAMEAQTRAQCDQMLAQAREKADQIIRDARTYAREMPAESEVALIAQIHELVDEETT